MGLMLRSDSDRYVVKKVALGTYVMDGSAVLRGKHRIPSEKLNSGSCRPAVNTRHNGITMASLRATMVVEHATPAAKCWPCGCAGGNAATGGRCRCLLSEHRHSRRQHTPTCTCFGDVTAPRVPPTIGEIEGHDGVFFAAYAVRERKDADEDGISPGGTVRTSDARVGQLVGQAVEDGGRGPEQLAVAGCREVACRPG